MPRPVVIVGAGPVGIVLALALARQGIEVRVFEAFDRIDESPRAATTQPATLEMLADLDLLDEVVRRGLVAEKFQFWDRPTGSMIAEFDHAVLKNDTRFPFVVQCEQHKLVDAAMQRIAAFPNASVELSARVTAIELHDDRVELTIETPNGTRTESAEYLVGADGGRSTVRKSTDIAFDGHTFPERFVVLTTPFDFSLERNYSFRNYFSDPDEWVNLFKVSGDDGRGLWRIVGPTTEGQSDEDILNDAAVQARLQKFFPKAGSYPVVHRNIYTVHQRVAASFRKGRAFLSGDAAHVNNPIGGLGLNCGIHDAVFLARLLTSVIRDGKPESALDRYDEVRRALNIEYVQQQTIANKKRLEETDPAVRTANFETLRRTAADPQQHRAFLLRTTLIASLRDKAAVALPPSKR